MESSPREERLRLRRERDRAHHAAEKPEQWELRDYGAELGLVIATVNNEYVAGEAELLNFILYCVIGNKALLTEKAFISKPNNIYMSPKGKSIKF